MGNMEGRERLPSGNCLESEGGGRSLGCGDPAPDSWCCPGDTTDVLRRRAVEESREGRSTAPLLPLTT